MGKISGRPAAPQHAPFTVSNKPQTARAIAQLKTEIGLKLNRKDRRAIKGQK